MINEDDKETSKSFRFIFGLIFLPIALWIVSNLFSHISDKALLKYPKVLFIGVLLFLSAIYLVVILVQLIFGYERKSGYLLHPFIHMIVSLVFVVIPIAALLSDKIKSNYEFNIVMIVLGVTSSVYSFLRFLKVYKLEKYDT